MLRVNKIFVLSILLALLSSFGCTLVPGVSGSNANLVGAWRVYSEKLFYDKGGSSYLNLSMTTRNLELTVFGTWNFGDSSGAWSVEKITEEDWKEWGIDAYGPTKKLVLDGWSGSKATGPIEESEENDRINFFWVVYRAEPPTVHTPGTVFIKFGHV